VQEGARDRLDQLWPSHLTKRYFFSKHKCNLHFSVKIHHGNYFDTLPSFAHEEIQVELRHEGCRSLVADTHIPKIYLNLETEKRKPSQKVAVGSSTGCAIE